MEDFWSFIGAFSITSATLAWLIRSLIVHFLSRDLETYKTKLKYELEHSNQLLLQKISLYKDVSDPIIKLISSINDGDKQIPKEVWDEFDKQRMTMTCHIAMFAPADVYHQFNELIDYIYDSTDSILKWDFAVFRQKAEVFFSYIRKDIGLYTDDISYRGHR
ncbi:hypothetical protein GCM10009098_07380 [Rheinheimera aquimaris]|uniref:DUF4760 domain-containing protein n=1 Tax=Rheinheimera aquimaris TaxID=412437 RepID=A0ABP3NE80_9GAMM|nr:hypothetical protein [Rheinheimera aquimaris]MCB5212089.1 hypothetical protein [Rheinheimera aquimaris]